MSEPKLNIKEETSAKKTRSPPKKAKVEQTVPKKKKLKTDAEKAAEKAQHLRFGKTELTPDELSRLSKAQKREMYAAHAARSAVHREVDQYEDENVGVQALSEGEKTAGNVRDISKSRYARKLKKKAKMQGKKGTKTARSSAQEPTAPQDAGASSTGEGGSNWLSRWKQRQEIHKSYYTAARSGTAAQTAGGKAASNGASAARSGVEQAVEKGKTAVSTAVKGLMNAAKGNAHVLVIVGVFLLLILMVMSGFSSCGILFSGGTQVSGQTMYSAEDRDIRGAEQDYKKLEKELDKKIKRTPTDHPGYNEYQYHLDPIEHDPWQLTSFLTTLYDDYTRSEVQGKLKETFKKQYKLTTWVEVQTRYMTVWVMTPAGIPVPTQVPYEYRIFHTKLVNRGLEVVIREELNLDPREKFSCPAGSVTGILSGGRGRLPLGRRVRHYRRRDAVRHRAAAGNQDPASQRPDLRPACRRKAGAQRGHRQGGSGKGHPRQNRPGCQTGTGRCPEKQNRGRPQKGLLDGISHLIGRKFWLARTSWYTHSCQSASQIRKMTI